MAAASTRSTWRQHPAGKILGVMLIFILIATLVLIFGIVLSPLAIAGQPTRNVPPPESGPFEIAVPPAVIEARGLGAFAGGQSVLPPPDRQRMLGDLSRIFGGIPFVSQMLDALSEFTPVLLALYLLRRSADPNIRRLLAFSRFLVSVHFSIYFVAAMNNLLGGAWFVAWERSLTEAVLQVLEASPIARTFGFTISGRYLGVTVLGVLLPFAIREWIPHFQHAERVRVPGTGRGKPRKPAFLLRAWPDLAFSLLAAVSALLAGYFIVTSSITPLSCGQRVSDFVGRWPASRSELFAPDLRVLSEAIACARPIWGWFVLLVGAALVPLTRWLVGRGTRLLGLNVPSLWLWTSALLLPGISLGAMPSLWDHWGTQQTRLAEGRFWFPVVIVLGLTLSLSLARACYAGLRSVMRIRRQISPQTLWVGLGILLIFSVPTLGLVDRGEPLGRLSDLYQLAYRLDDCLILLWVAAALHILYLDGRDDLTIDESSRVLAVLAGGLFFFGLSQQFMYIPVPFLVGCAVLWWITDLPALQDQPSQDPDQLREWIRTFSLVRLSEQLYGGIRRENTKKLAKGDLQLPGFFSELGTYEESKRDKEALLPTRQDGSRINPLAFGPYSSAWQNAMHGLSWSVLLGLPWIALYLFSFLAETRFNVVFPLLNFIPDIAMLVGLWAAIGFAMGYFFPYLRGSSGLQKGLVLGLALIVARLPLSLIYNRGLTDWQATLVLAMQIFSLCLLLGLLAFDYYVLNKWHFSFQQLLEIHGLSGLGIWLSSLAVAFLAALTPLLATQTQAAGLLRLLVTIVGKIIGVDLGNVDFTPE